MNRLFAALALLIAATAEASTPLPLSLPRQDQQPVALQAYPPEAGDCRGIAVISPGAGGSEAGYAYLARAMSAQGYFAAVVGHRESGADALAQQVRAHGLREGLARLIVDRSAYEGRFMDIAAARQWLQARCSAGPSILLGHSMGAATTLIEAGAQNKLGVRGANAFDAYVALSPQGVGTIFPAQAWRGITRPVLSITGTRDAELGGGGWESRKQAFADMPPGCKWLAVIDGASHMNLAGRGLSPQGEALTVQTIEAFLRAVRARDCQPPPPQPGIDVQAK